MFSKPLLSVLAFVGFTANAAHTQATFFGKVSSVTDGDTLWVRPDAGGAPHKLRIEGLDAPEICQPGGAAARSALQQFALHQRVGVTVRAQDEYGRGLARIELKGHDLGAQLVQAGQAWSYRWRQSPGPYAAEEALARQARRGLFAQENPERPRDFRKRYGSCQSARE